MGRYRNNQRLSSRRACPRIYSLCHPDVKLIGISIFKTCLLGNPFRANSRSPLQEEYDSELNHRSRRSVSGSSLCSWRESASITSSRSEPHFPGCSSGHHFPTKSASPPRILSLYVFQPITNSTSSFPSKTRIK